jgi:hypothetical protein
MSSKKLFNAVPPWKNSDKVFPSHPRSSSMLYHHEKIVTHCSHVIKALQPIPTALLYNFPWLLGCLLVSTPSHLPIFLKGFANGNNPYHLNSSSCLLTRTQYNPNLVDTPPPPRRLHSNIKESLENGSWVGNIKPLEMLLHHYLSKYICWSINSAFILVPKMVQRHLM